MFKVGDMVRYIPQPEYTGVIEQIYLGRLCMVRLDPNTDNYASIYALMSNLTPLEEILLEILYEQR